MREGARERTTHIEEALRFGAADLWKQIQNPNAKCISAFSTQTQIFVPVGCQHGPLLASQIAENLSLEGVWASPGRSWEAPEGSSKTLEYFTACSRG